MSNLLRFTSLTVSGSMLAASSTYLASSMLVLHHQNTDKGMIYQYCTHISPYPKITHFEKWLLNFNTLKEYGLSPPFQCIHQLCLFPAKKMKQITMARSRVVSFSIVYSTEKFHFEYRPKECQQ